MTITCRDRFKKIIGVARICARICGADSIAENYRVNFLTLMVVTSIFAFYCCTVYTIYIGTIVNGDWTVILQALCMVGSAVQGAFKLFVHVTKPEILRDLVYVLDQIYLEYEQKHSRYRFYLNKTTATVTRLLRTMSFMYVAGMIVIISYPILSWVIFHEKVFVMQFLLPGIDETTDMGHFWHIGSHILCLSFGAFGNFAGDLFLFVFIIHMTLMKDIMRCKFEDLNEMLHAEPHYDYMKTLPMIIDILRWHQKYKSIAEQIDDLYTVVIFVQIFSTSSGICFTLFCLFLGVWPAGYAYLIYSFIILYVYCGLGTVVEISNDNLTTAIYNDCLWYELSLIEQKMILLMLETSQYATALSVGKIMPLSVATALQMTKAIYSYMMMLIRFVDGE